MVVLNNKDVRQKTGGILEQKSNLMGEETGMDKKWTLHLENFMSHPSRIPLVLNVHSARLTGKYAGENRAGTGWDRVDSS